MRPLAASRVQLELADALLRPVPVVEVGVARVAGLFRGLEESVREWVAISGTLDTHGSVGVVILCVAQIALPLNGQEALQHLLATPALQVP